MGEIIKQTPSGGTRKKYNASALQTITVTLNPPAKVFVLDDYTNANAQEVTTILRRNEIVWNLKSEDHDTVIKGYVIKTDPAPGTVLNKGDSITLYVSNGAPVEETEVPNVLGKTYEDAVRELQKNRISIGTVSYEESAAPEGTVVAQSLAEGEKVYKYISEIDLTVSMGMIVIPTPEQKEEEPKEDDSTNVGEGENTENEGENEPVTDDTQTDTPEENTPENADEESTPDDNAGENTDSPDAKEDENPSEKPENENPDENATEV